MNATVSDFAKLLLRLWLGLNLVLAHGLPKLADPQAFLASEGVQVFPLPALSGWFAIAAEVGGGACLALGLYTRASAAAVLATMLGAGLIAQSSWTWTPGKELALTYAAVALMFLVLGAGPLSLDARLGRRRRPSPW